MAKYWRVLGSDGELTFLITEDQDREEVFNLVLVRPDAGDILSIPSADKVQAFLSESVPTDWTIQEFSDHDLFVARSWFRRHLKDGVLDPLWDQLDAAVATWVSNDRPALDGPVLRGSQSDFHVS